MKITTATTALLSLVLLALVPPAPASADPFAGGAQACLFEGEDVTCFDTEADLDEFLALRPTPRSNCSTPVRLYSGTNFTGTLVAVAGPRNVWLNLSAYSFDNQTRSYRIGNCSTTFARDHSGLGGYYPGITLAGTSSTLMITGWSAAISSIYIA